MRTLFRRSLGGQVLEEFGIDTDGPPVVLDSSAFIHPMNPHLIAFAPRCRYET